MADIWSQRRATRYGRYDGGPDPLAPPVDLAEALDEIGEDVMAGYSPERALREFLRRGGQDQQGLDDLARRVAERRRELAKRHNLDGTLEEVRELLDRAVLEERKQLARDVAMDDGDRALREMQLDSLPHNPAAAVSELGSYDWQSTQAREAYEQIKDLLGRELLDQRFQGMKQALENATDEDRAAIDEMLGDLNELLEKRQRGEDTQEDFEEFMRKHGDQFPEDPQDLDELLDAMAARAAADQRMLNSMSPEQRQQLMELSAQAFGSPQLMESLARLDSHLQALRPGEDWSGSEQMGGEGAQGVGMGDGTGVFQDLAELDALHRRIKTDFDRMFFETRAIFDEREANLRDAIGLLATPYPQNTSDRSQEEQAMRARISELELELATLRADLGSVSGNDDEDHPRLERRSTNEFVRPEGFFDPPSDEEMASVTAHVTSSPPDGEEEEESDTASAAEVDGDVSSETSEPVEHTSSGPPTAHEDGDGDADSQPESTDEPVEDQDQDT